MKPADNLFDKHRHALIVIPNRVLKRSPDSDRVDDGHRFTIHSLIGNRKLVTCSLTRIFRAYPLNAHTHNM